MTRILLRLAPFVALVAVLVLIGVGTGPAQSQTAAKLDKLVAAAKAEGSSRSSRLPHDWCGYGEVIESFKTKYGLTVNELNPDAGSGDEIEAIKANKGNKGPQAPDVIDVGLSFGPSAKKDGLVQPYKVSTWELDPRQRRRMPRVTGTATTTACSRSRSTPTSCKNVPADWADLLASDYKNSVALAGDPRASNQAIQAVFAAGLSAADGNVDKAGEAGLEVLRRPQQEGQLRAGHRQGRPRSPRARRRSSSAGTTTPSPIATR